LAHLSTVLMEAMNGGLYLELDYQWPTFSAEANTGRLSKGQPTRLNGEMFGRH
jgi:hypothetical protein